MIEHKKKFQRLCRFIFVMFCALSSAVSNAQEPILSEAQALRDTGKVQQAYRLLQVSADAYAGNLDFDYLLGKMAIDAGQPLDAIFALERVIDQHPDFAPVRAEIARAYFLIGENEAAKVEFKKAQKASMPAGSKKLIASYLSTIDERILGGVSASSFFISAGLGYDSNVNSATSTSQIAIPTGILTLQSSETDSAVGLVQGGGRFSHAIKRHIKVFGNADLRLYEAFDESNFSTQIIDGVIGLHFLKGVNQYRVSLVTQVFALDGSANRNLLGINSQWQRSIDAANQFTLFGQYASLRFPDASRLDVNQLSIGGTWLHVLANSNQPIVYFTAYYGDEKEQTSIAGSEFIGREYFGLRAGMQLKSSARLVWSGVLSYQQSEYGGDNPLFGKTREDDFISLIVAADYLFNDGWTLRPEVSYSDNDSNLEINSYDRIRALLIARKVF
ncbi:MAG: DUF560 domain-containing protein [Gammaproteobacteria bacterium]|nr:DUF560 domain-containing protein [Gammaproteobacteria bacterium]